MFTRIQLIKQQKSSSKITPKSRWGR